ncbi:MAG: hypothetical protein ACFFFO_07080 [Candidatus Thorarchaeota archaeon]
MISNSSKRSNDNSKRGTRKLFVSFVIGVLFGLLLFTPISIWAGIWGPHESGFNVYFVRDEFNLILDETSSPYIINASDYWTSGLSPNPGIFAIEVIDLHTYGSPFSLYFISNNVTVHQLFNITDQSNYSIRIGPSPVWTEQRLNSDLDVGDIWEKDYQLKFELVEAPTVVHFTFAVWYATMWME